ncbi:uncharacterized protein LACBIDRAFT_328728 [Laccaria bicolor S238N-H82]|uniref:Predicted protein n=1 Tax=Laccaria bicolor (strain S238N-H82 / ATCC MYA-4686) TaxID=486041 RepID=B0DFT7_LACBS|nr:uncharacterized protein LACBIDRAFT_328728 [Laccaria bicolor S238N-H82]EDR06519.1 predicted protein [Laccaria bicolor S238N-H82]|eukprot:XP_001882891.1 predicted protein [Laccaria bicolor S238N-H82]
MSIPQNALPATVKLRESALTAFKTYQDMKEGLNSAAAPTILGVTTNYCMAVDNLFGDEEVKDTASSPKEKGKKRAASGPKTPAKSKRAETVSIPYDAVPGMDTNSREFHKALVVEHAKGSCAGDKCPRTEPPFISGLADLQSRQNESANSLLIDNPLYREILARAHAAVTNRMPAYPTLAYFKQQEVDLRERVLLSMQRLDLELRLRDVLVADYEIALAQIAEREVTKE